MKRGHIIITVVAAIALIAVGVLGTKLFEGGPRVTVNADVITERLSECSDLTTARLDYRGLIKYTEGEIPLITKKSFSMVYDACIKAGIDLSGVSVTISGKTAKITVPKPMLQEITVDSESLEFYDESFALFNWTKKEDTITAIEYARKDAEAKAESSELLEQAEAQAELVISTLLAPLTEAGQIEYRVMLK